MTAAVTQYDVVTTECGTSVTLAPVSPNVFVESIPICFDTTYNMAHGGPVLCAPHSTAYGPATVSQNVKANNLGVARQGDLMPVGGSVTDIVATAQQQTVFVNGLGA